MIVPLESTVTFYLVRHAHAFWSPDENRSLSNQGHCAAQSVAQLLRCYPITLIYSSPSLRARQTLMPLAEALALPLGINPNLRERNLAGTAVPSHAFENAVRATWEDSTFCHTGGETNREAKARGMTTIEELRRRHPGSHIALGTHGNLLALMLQSFDTSIGFEFWTALTMPDVYRLRIADSGPCTIDRLWTSLAKQPALDATHTQQG